MEPRKEACAIPDETRPPSAPRGSRLARWVGRPLWCAWVVFVGWLFVYGMPLSGLVGVLGAWVARPGGTWRWCWVGLVWLVGIVALPVVGFGEFAATTNRLHCRTLGFTGARPSSDCDPADVARGREVAAEGGWLYSRRERLGVHGFNHLMALGGVVVGLPEVAAETVWLSWTADPFDGRADEQSRTVRRAQCRASHDNGSGARLAPALTLPGQMPMRSSSVRKTVAAGVGRLAAGAGATRSLGAVHFIKGAHGDPYLHPLLHDSVRVALALEVGDSRLGLTRRDDGAVEVAWQGTIHYPGIDAAFGITIPTPWGWRVLRVSEPVFCGMHIDGAMNPYPLRYRWTLTEDDPRLTPGGREESRRGIFEGLARWAALAL